MNPDQRLQTLDDLLMEPARRGLLLQTAEDEMLDGRTVTIDGRSLVNFGSCSYLGLELDPRLREGVMDAVTRYGTQFSSSRTYLSAPLYREVEETLAELFGGPVVMTSSTTLGHISALPVLISQHDAVILDQQVHHSVHLGASQVRLQGTHVELVRHSRMDLLEQRIEALKSKHRRIWYLADGVYSMYADVAPVDELEKLMDRHEQLHLYVDDSHGVSWAGPHGRGQFLGDMPIRERVVVANSLNKAFAAGGAALVFPDAELARRVRLCGGPMIFSGPVQPPMLGAALASARLHLTPEIDTLQAGLAERVALFNRLATERGLPVVSLSDAPIRCVGVGKPGLAQDLTRRLLDDGLYVNVAMFPAVPMSRAGIRAPLTLHHTHEDIERLVDALAHHLPEVLHGADTTVEEVAAAFGKRVPATAPATGASGRSARRRARNGLTLEHVTTIGDVNAREWDALLGGRGSFTAAGLQMLEQSMRDNERPEDNWDWDYFVVRDAEGAPVLATFFTHALWKDDMLSPAEVSRRVEESRREDPYHLTSYTYAMGSLLTEGEHLFLDRTRDWQTALTLMLDGASRRQEHYGAKTLVLRDFRDGDPAVDQVLRDAGLVKAPILDGHVLELDFADEDEFLARLSYRSRRHQLREVRPWQASYEVEVLRAGGRPLDAPLLAHLHELYKAVEARGLELNSFDLPPEVFARIAEHPEWELVLLYLRPEAGGPEHGLPVAFGACFLGAEHYAAMVVGLDYEYVVSHGAYRQILWQVVRRARALGARRLLWGMGASLEKTRFGARPERRCAYSQTSDTYSLEVLEQIAADAGPELNRRSRTATR